MSLGHDAVAKTLHSHIARCGLWCYTSFFFSGNISSVDDIFIIMLFQIFHHLIDSVVCIYFCVFDNPGVCAYTT